MAMKYAKVKLWNTLVGVVDEDTVTGEIRFNYDDDFIQMGVELSPITMPLGRTVFHFPNLRNSHCFRGLPGLLADSMPDKFGNAIIAKYLAEKSISEEEFGAVDRLLYTGKRGMGALEYEPNREIDVSEEESIELMKLVKLSSDILSERENVNINERDATMAQIISVGTSAGGARAKAVIAWNRETGDIRSGQATPRRGYENWLIKFDGVDNNKDIGDVEADPKCLTRIEYAYYLMAKKAGIEMSQCELLERDDLFHFMTKRFDRTDDGKKIHMQSLGAIAHYDLTNSAGTNSYEQAANIIKRMGLGKDSVLQFYRRAVFNVCSKNNDDHVKNTSFLMSRQGEWCLSPAYDLTYAYKASSKYTRTHHLSLNNKLDSFELVDLLAYAKKLDISEKKAFEIITEVQEPISRWMEYAEIAKVTEMMANAVRNNQTIFKF